MGYKTGEIREQMILLPECIDDYITDENPVQVIDVFVDSLDFENLGFKYAKLKDTGRRPYNPGDMLKLYLYGYYNRIRSSRRLEKESKRNIELMWLLRKLTPDYRTIADFRKDNKNAIKSVFKEFIFICKKLELFGGEVVAIDGTKFKAVNSNKRNFTSEKLSKRIKELEEKINNYLEELDVNDDTEAEEIPMTAEGLKEKLKLLRDRKDKYENLAEKLKENGETQVSLTDPDSRYMRNNKKFEVCYNTQATVDSKNKLIVDFEVTNQVIDIAQLEPMAKRAKDILEVGTLEVLADKGYYNPVQIKECIDNGITPYISKPANNAAGLEEDFCTAKFRYIEGKDVYICPAEKELIYRERYKCKGKILRRYCCFECQGCSLKDKCTKRKEGRRISRWEHQNILDEMEKRMKKDPSKYKQRMCLAEHPFGTIKMNLNFRYLLTRGFEKVKAEVSLIMLSYNLIRAMNIVGIRRLIGAIA